MHSATALSSKSFRFHCKERVSIKDGILANGFSFSRPFLTTQRLSVGLRERESVIVRASAEDKEEKKKKRKKKVDTHSFVVKPDEATGAFPEAVLLKEVILVSPFSSSCLSFSFFSYGFAFVISSGFL